MPMTFATNTHTGLVRGSNEDAFYARPPVFVIADGMGGAQAGEVASAMAAKAFEYFLPQSSRPEEELEALITRANTSIFEYASADPQRTGMGTTITSAAVNGTAVAIAHVGDSRAWLIRTGQLRRLTEDHSLVAEMIRGGQLTEAEAAEHPQRSVITRALGVEPTVKVDTYSVPWEKGDIFLLASDGLYGMVSETEIAAIVGGGGDLRDIADDLIEAANQRGGKDNITVVLFSPDGSVPGMDAHEESSSATAKGASPSRTNGNGPAQPEPPADRSLKGRFRRFRSTTPGIVVLAAVIIVALIGGLFGASRLVFFVGVDGDQVAIFRGVPYELGGLPLFSMYKGSPLKLKSLEGFEQDRVMAQNLQTKGGAEQMLTNLLVSEKNKRDEELKAEKEKERADRIEDARKNTKNRNSR